MAFDIRDSLHAHNMGHINHTLNRKRLHFCDFYVWNA